MAVVAAAGWVGVPRAAAAQGSPYVPLDDPAYAYIDALQARGRLRTLSVLERPYTVSQVRAALAADGTASGVVSGWHRAVGEWIRRYELPAAPAAASGLALTATAGALATWQSSARRELMLADTASGVYPGVWGRVFAAGGPMVVGWRIIADRRYRPDPEYQGSKKRWTTGRMEDAYLAGQWRLGEIFLGRQARNWGPPPLDGLQLGDYAYSYDQLYGRLGSEALHLSTLLTRLDDKGKAPDSVVQRYLALHRVGVHWRGWDGGVSEAILYGGVGRGFELAYANPLNVFMLSQYNEGRGGNVSYGFDLAYRTRGRGTYAGQLLWDDFQIDKCKPQCQEPPSYGYSLMAEGVPLVGPHRAFASYTRISNLAYRTPEPLETYDVFGVGIGRGFSDYDEARVGLDLALTARATTRWYAAYRRQGEGDYRLPYPRPEDYASTPEIFAGVVMRVARVGVQAAGRILPFAALSADVGVNRVTNDGHQPGRNTTALEGRIRLSLEPRRPLGLRIGGAGGHIPASGP